MNVLSAKGGPAKEDVCIVNTVHTGFSDILFSDKSRSSDNFAEDHFFST